MLKCLVNYCKKPVFANGVCFNHSKNEKIKEYLYAKRVRAKLIKEINKEFKKLYPDEIKLEKLYKTFTKNSSFPEKENNKALLSFYHMEVKKFETKNGRKVSKSNCRIARLRSLERFRQERELLF